MHISRRRKLHLTDFTPPTICHQCHSCGAFKSTMLMLDVLSYGLLSFCIRNYWNSQENYHVKRKATEEVKKWRRRCWCCCSWWDNSYNYICPPNYGSNHSKLYLTSIAAPKKSCEKITKKMRKGRPIMVKKKKSIVTGTCLGKLWICRVHSLVNNKNCHKERRVAAAALLWSTCGGKWGEMTVATATP